MDDSKLKDVELLRKFIEDNRLERIKEMEELKEDLQESLYNYMEMGIIDTDSLSSVIKIVLNSHNIKPHGIRAHDNEFIVEYEYRGDIEYIEIKTGGDIEHTEIKSEEEDDDEWLMLN